MKNLKLTLHPNLDKQALFANGSYGYIEDINGSVIADMRCSNTTDMAPSLVEAEKYSKLFKKSPKMLEALKESGRLISCGKCESGLKVIESILKELEQ